MSLLPISMTFWDYDRVQALADGRVRIEGCDAVHFDLDLHDIFFRAIRSQDFDVTEMSFSSYMMMVANGNPPYTAIPVFLSRMFRHSAFFIRTDRGIGGVEHPGRPEKVDLNLPSDMEVEAIPTNKSLSPMLAAGELDAILAPLPPSCFTRGAPNVGRLFPDYHAAEKAYWQKTRHFPIMHVCAIRTSLVEQYPWLAGNVFNAFSEAKDLATKRLNNFGAAKATLPWLAAEHEETVALMGEDYWPYGVENNRIALENATRYSYEQGLSSRKLDIEELFAPSTLEQWKS